MRDRSVDGLVVEVNILPLGGGYIIERPEKKNALMVLCSKFQKKNMFKRFMRRVSLCFY